VVEDAGAGLAVKPGDARALAEAVRSLANDPARAEEMGRRGRAGVERDFNRKDQAQQMEKALEDCFGRKIPKGNAN
jgi:glycosyltransferase involved in cell wall biosynthesis